MKILTDKRKNSTRVTQIPLRLTRAVNLRRDKEDSSIWRPAGKPSLLSAQPGIPVARFIPEGGTAVATFWLDGRKLCVSVSETGDTDIYSRPRSFLGNLPAEPIEFIPLKGGIVKVMLAHHVPAYITYDASLAFTLATSMPRFPAIGIYATRQGMLHEAVAGRKLTGGSDGRSPGTLAAADNTLLVNAAMEAYTALKAKAQASGIFLQPVLTRYRILDPEGETLVCGPWIMPSAADGFQCTGAVSFPSADKLATVTDGVIQARTYMLATSAMPPLPSPWDIIASRLIIETTAQIDPVSPGGSLSPGYVDVDEAKGISSARVYLPGCSPEKASRPGLNSHLVVGALSEAETTGLTVLEIPFPFHSQGSGEHIIGASPVEFGGKVPPMSPRYSYSSSLRAGQALFLADPRMHRRPPLSPETFALTTSQGVSGGNWSTRIESVRSPLSNIVTADTGRISGNLPATLSPLLMVNDPEATHLTFQIERPDGSVATRKFPLTPLPGAGIAYYLDSDLTPLEFEDATEFKPAVSNPVATPDYGVIHCYPSGGAAGGFVAGRPVRRPITCMAQSPRSGSSWDFARTKVVVFSEEGIYVATYSENGAMRASAPLDTRPVLSPHLVTKARTAKDGACLLAVAGDDLVRIHPSRTETLATGCMARAIGWCDTSAELWLSTSGGLKRYTADGDFIEVLSDDLASSTPHVLHHWGNKLLISTSDGLFDTSQEMLPDVSRCILRLKGEATDRPRHLEAWVLGSSVTGSVTLSGDNGSEIPEMLCAFGLRGQVNTPLQFPLRLPFRRFLTLEADVRISPDGTLRVP